MNHQTALLATVLALAGLTPAVAQEGTPGSAEATAQAAPAEASPADPMAADAPATPASTAADPSVAETVSAAEGEPDDKYPVSASFGVSYRFNHANFVDTESEDTTFGYQLGTVSASVAYSPIDSVSLSALFAVDKELSDSFDRAPVMGGTSSRTRRATSLRDVAVSADWNFYTVPVADIELSTNLSLGLPTSKASQAAGMLLAVSPGVGASWSAKGFGVSAAFAYTYLVNEDPTQQIDCQTAPQNCQVAGRDLGSPNALHSWFTQFGLSYKIIPRLSVSATYVLTNTIGAVEFPEDEFTSPYAQVGTQYGQGSHGTMFGVSFKVLDKTSLSASMGTVRNIYTNDGTEVTVPIFDFDSNKIHRTYYQIGLTQSL